MAEAIGALSMTKKANHQLYNLTSSFEEVLFNDQMRVTLTFSVAVKALIITKRACLGCGFGSNHIHLYMLYMRNV